MIPNNGKDVSVYTGKILDIKKKFKKNVINVKKDDFVRKDSNIELLCPNMHLLILNTVIIIHHVLKV